MLDKILYNIWDCTITCLFLTLVLFGIWFGTVCIVAFIAWDLDPFRAFIGWGALRLSTMIALIFTAIWFAEEGHLEYDRHVPNKDWLKNGKWF